MGIKDLLLSLKGVTVQRHIESYSGQTVAIDTYVWLHQIIKGCCKDQARSFHLSNRFIREVLRRLNSFKRLGIKVIMVLDGSYLPNKASEEQHRKDKRYGCQEEAIELLNLGQNVIAHKKLVQAIDITPEIAQRLIIVLKNKNIPFIVAPYQADAQLAYMSRTGIVDVVITSDSDLLAYGAKKVLFKYSHKTCLGQELDLEKLKDSDNPCLKGYSHCMFLTACILSGCDYAKSIYGVGLKTSFKLTCHNKTGLRCIKEAQKSKKVQIDYQQKFVKAYLTFRFQYVFCPIAGKCVMLNDMERAKENLNPSSWAQQVLDEYILSQISLEKYTQYQDFLGKHLDVKTARGVAEGVIHPMTLKPYSTTILHRVFDLRRSVQQVKRFSAPLGSIVNTREADQNCWDSNVGPQAESTELELSPQCDKPLLGQQEGDVISVMRQAGMKISGRFFKQEQLVYRSKRLPPSQYPKY